MAKKKKKDKEIVGVAVSVAPVVKERDKKKSGGAMTEKNTWEKTNIEKKKRYGMKEGGKGIEALRKEAPEVVERMGYGLGGLASKMSKNLLKLFKKDEKVKNIVKEIEKQKVYIKNKGYEKDLKDMGEYVNDLTPDERLEYTKEFAEIKEYEDPVEIIKH